MSESRTIVLQTCALAAIYLVLAGTISLAEVAAGIAAALIAAALAAGIRRVGGHRFAVPGFALRDAARTLGQMVQETGLVGAFLAGACLRGPRVEGGFGTMPLEEPARSPTARSKRARTIIARSLAPNTYVLRRFAGAFELHRLVLPDRGADEGGSR